MSAPSCRGLCTYHAGIHNLLYTVPEVIFRQITDTELWLEQFQGFGGTRMCKVGHCFSYLAQNGQRNHCPTIGADMGFPPLWFMPPVDSILNVFPDAPVQQNFQVGVLSVVWFLIFIQDTTRGGRIDRCDGSNQGVGSIRRLPHHMTHTMEVWIPKEPGTQLLFSLRVTVRIIKITVQDVQNTTRVNLVVIQAIRTPRGVWSEWPISRKRVGSHVGPVFRMEQSISSPLSTQLVPSGRFQAGALIMKAGVVGGRAQIAVPAAVTMTLGCMAARGFGPTPLARYGLQLNESII